MRPTAGGRAEHDFTRQVIAVGDHQHVVARFFRPKFERSLWQAYLLPELEAGR